ncbi:MAG: glycosyltransferase family 4 protein [Thermincolia bacterium]
MAKINLLQLIRPVAGGMKEHLCDLVANLDGERFNIVVACPRDSAVAREVAALGIQVVPVDMQGEISLWSDLKVISQLVRILREGRIDILHAHSSKAGLVGRVAAILAGTPAIVFTVHNFIFYDNLSALKKKVYALAEKILAYPTNTIITVSNALRDGIIKTEGINPDKIVTIYNGIDTRPFEKAVNKDRLRQKLKLESGPVIGTVARLAPQKGVGYLVEAAAKVVMEYPEAQFLVAGDGPLLPELKQQAVNLGIEKNIRFLGHWEDIAHLFAVLDVFVLPSVTEGLGLTVLEALAAERPVIATNVGGLPEIVHLGQTGLLAKVRDPVDLAKQILYMLNNPGEAERMALTGKVMVKEKFALETMIKATTKVYLNCMSNSR